MKGGPLIRPAIIDSFTQILGDGITLGDHEIVYILFFGPEGVQFLFRIIDGLNLGNQGTATIALHYVEIVEGPQPACLGNSLGGKGCIYRGFRDTLNERVQVSDHIIGVLPPSNEDIRVDSNSACFPADSAT